jgi:hypothetical protein
MLVIIYDKFVSVIDKERRNKMTTRPEQREREVYNPLQGQVPNILYCNMDMEIPGTVYHCQNCSMLYYIEGFMS